MLTVTARSPIVPDRQNRPVIDRSGGYAGHVGLAMLAAGAVYLLGSLIDVAVLWGLQRQGVPQWEFVAIGSTLDAFPRFTLAFAFLYGALYFRRSQSAAAYRILALGLVLAGLAAAVLGALMATDYLALARITPRRPAALELLKTTTLKGIALSAVFCVLLVPIGLLGFRRPGLGRVAAGSGL